jgi:hypothetical protein
MSDQWECGDCGFRPMGKGRPTGNTCRRCCGDFTWRPVLHNDGCDVQMHSSRMCERGTKSCVKQHARIDGAE